MPGCVTAAGSAACACKSQLASLLAFPIAPKLCVPPPRPGRAAGAGAGAPDVCVTDTVITALTAAAAIATIIIERKNRSRINGLLLSFSVSLQRLIPRARNGRGVVFCRRIGTPALFEGEIFHTRSPQQTGER